MLRPMIPFLSINDVYNIIGIIVGLYIAKLLARRIYDAYFGPLSRIPGPKLNALTTIFHFPIVLSGRWWKLLHHEYHPKYGPIFRFDTYGVVIGDRDAIKEFIVNMDLPKNVVYDAIRRVPHSGTLFSTRDKAFHKQRRRILSPAFSIQYLASLDPLIQVCVKDLIFKIDEIIQGVESGNDGIVNIYKLVHHTALDAIGETSFGGKFGIVLAGAHPLPKAIIEILTSRMIRGLYPILAPFMQDKEYLYNFSSKIIKARRQETVTKKKDILQILLDTSSDKDAGLTDEDVYDQIVEFIYAGSDTTSWSTSFAMILLAQNQDKLDKLAQELVEAIPEMGPDHLPNYKTLKRLPYLNAVVNETLRLWPVTIEGGSYRIADKDIMLKGYFIPKGTVLMASYYYMHLSEEYWGEDAKEFVPERWLDEARIPRDAFLPFSAGSRNCIGQNFALLEMRLIIASLVRRYRFLDIPGQALDIRQFVTPGLKNEQYNLQVSARE